MAIAEARGSTGSKLQHLPAEITDLIVIACISQDHLKRQGLRRLATVCRSLRYSILPHIYAHLAFLIRDRRWSLFPAFTSFIESYPSCGRHIKRLTAELPRDATAASIVTPQPLLPANFGSLQNLELPNLYLLPAILDVPLESPCFPQLYTIRFYANPTLSEQGPAHIQVSTDHIQAIWRSPKLRFVRFMYIEFRPGESSTNENLQPVAILSLSGCKFADGALEQLTSVRPIRRLDLKQTTVEPSQRPIPHIFQVDLEGSASLRGSPSLGLFPDLRSLSLTDEQFHEISMDGRVIFGHLSELQVTVDVVNRRRERFLKALHQVLEQQTPSLSQLELQLECEVPSGTMGDSDDEASPVRIPCIHGDWGTGFPRYGIYTEDGLEIDELGTGPNGMITLSGPNDDDDYMHFKGFKALKTLYAKRGITVKCTWSAREC